MNSERKGRIIIKKAAIISTAVVCIIAGILLWNGWSNKPVRAVKVDTGSPKGVAEAYFAYMNAKDIDNVKALFTERYNTPNMVWSSPKSLEYIKLISIEEVTDKSAREGYSKFGPGSLTGVKDENFIMYRVEYVEKYRFHRAGTYNKDMTVTRKDSYSPWLIDEFGYP